MNKSVKLGLLFCLFCIALPLAFSWNGIKLKGDKKFASFFYESSNQKYRFLLGANIPWFKYGGDFGKNDWGKYGVSTKEAKVKSTFNKLKQAKGNTVRWFLFADGRAGIKTNKNGAPTGLDGKVYDDIDAAVKIAKSHGISINFVIINSFYRLNI